MTAVLSYILKELPCVFILHIWTKQLTPNSSYLVSQSTEFILYYFLS